MNFIFMCFAVLAGMIARPPAITIDIGSAADWISGAGSLLAVVVALHGFRIVERQRQTDKRDAEIGLAYEVASILLDISNHLSGVSKHLKDNPNMIEIHKGALEVKKYRFTHPLVGLSNEGEWTFPNGSSELVIKACGYNWWNQARLLISRNRSITALLKEYQVIWTEAAKKLPLPVDDTGLVRRAPANSDTQQSLQDDLVRIDSFLASLNDQVDNTAKLLEEVSSEFGPGMKKYLGIPFVHFSRPENPE